MPTPYERYRRDLASPGFVHDAAQENAVLELQDLHDRLIVKATSKGVLSRLLPGKKKNTAPERGLYFWGGVGRGKTYLMDNFYESLPFEEKMRAHFHRFMRRVHAELKALSGEKNPLEKVADRIAAEARVICFDEFFVSDITDAMILGTLLGHLFERGVSLVATSNIVPDGLYKDGLQRQRFLPAIALLKEHCKVINVDGGVDYRLRALKKAEIYHSPLGCEADEALTAAFKSLVPAMEEICTDADIQVEGRKIPSRFVGEDVVWFDFKALCDGPRSQNDYIEIAREFHAVLVSNVPQLQGSMEDQARRFINMVDEFYDRGVKLIVSAAVNLEDIYAGSRLVFEFERTRSRLLEMQSHEYLARPHKP
ncbi:MAG: cell division protein ZapE [Porticoccaceae bacterium]|nr:cell division protein ZapE [Porticoccaceae bacterium]